MKGKQRVLTAMRRGQPDCVPVMPQIWLDHAARISGIAPLDIIQHPELGARTMLLTARHYGLDGFRTWVIYEPRRVLSDRVRLSGWEKLRIAARWSLLRPRRSALP